MADAQQTPGDTTSYRQSHKDALDALINKQILLLEAAAESLKVEDSEVAQAVDDAIANNIHNLGEDGFRDELKKQGLTEDGLRARYREDARKQIMITKLIRKNITPKVTVSDSAIVRLYNDQRAQLPKKPPRFWVQDLFVQIKPDSVLLDRARARAVEIRQKIKGGLSFAEAANRYSDDTQAGTGGALGRFEKGRMTPELEATAYSLPLGQVSEPVPSPSGYHLIQVTARDSAGQWVELSHILFAAPPSKVDHENAAERAEKVFQQVGKEKMDFTDAVRRFSDDSQSKANGGDVGWVPIDAFGDMKGAIDSLAVGGISRPLEAQGGFHIFKVLGKQPESDYTFAEIQDQLKQMATQQAEAKETQAWLVDLRKKFFVDVRATW